MTRKSTSEDIGGNKDTDMARDITLRRMKATPEDIGGNEPFERFPLQLDGVDSGQHAAQSKEHLQAGHFAVRDTLGREVTKRDTLGRKSLKEIFWGGKLLKREIEVFSIISILTSFPSLTE